MTRAGLAALAALLLWACGDDDADGGVWTSCKCADAGDGAEPDAAALDAGTDAGGGLIAGGGLPEAGHLDAGRDGGAPDPGPPDAGPDPAPDAASDAAPDAGGTATPNAAALQLSWKLVPAGGGATLACADVPAVVEVSIALTPEGTSDLFGSSATCDIGVATVTDLAFGDYTLVVQLLDGASGSLGGAPAQSVSLTSQGCDAIVDGECVHALTVELVLD